MISLILKSITALCIICETAMLNKYQKDKNIYGITANGFILIVFTMLYLYI